MTFLLADRVKETTTTEGTGSITLNGADAGFQTFADAIGDGNSTYYVIENYSQWEVGIGTYSSTGNVLSRDTILDSSNSGNPINIAVDAVVFCSLPAGNAVVADEAGLITSFSPSYAGIKFPDNTVQITAAGGGGGGNTRTFRTVTSSETLALSDEVIFIDTTSGSLTITLPFASATSGRTFAIKFITGSNTASIVPQGVDNLDGGSSFVMNYVNQAISAFSDGDNWFIL